MKTQTKKLKRKRNTSGSKAARQERLRAEFLAWLSQMAAQCEFVVYELHGDGILCDCVDENAADAAMREIESAVSAFLTAADHVNRATAGPQFLKSRK